MVETNKDGRFTICWDPLDGSSIVDNNWAVGTIVGIWDKTTGMLGATGRDQVTSIVVLYGPRTTALVACDDGVYEFTCGAGNKWFASREQIKIKEVSQAVCAKAERGARRQWGGDEGGGAGGHAHRQCRVGRMLRRAPCDGASTPANILWTSQRAGNTRPDTRRLSCALRRTPRSSRRPTFARARRTLATTNSSSTGWRTSTPSATRAALSPMFTSEFTLSTALFSGAVWCQCARALRERARRADLHVASGWLWAKAAGFAPAGGLLPFRCRSTQRGWVV